MERIKLNASIREEKRKNKVKKLRAASFVPACLYKKGKESISIKVDKSALFKVLHTKAGENVIIDLIIEEKSKKAHPVMIKEIQAHPTKDTILHVDFNEISLTEKIKVNIPIASKGSPEAITKESGTLEHIMWEIEIECLPTEIPEKIEVNVAELKIGDKIYVKDLVLPSGVKVLTDPELIVMSGEPPHVEEVVEEGAAEGEATEPEVIAKGKKEEEEEGEGEETKEAPPPKEKEEKK